MVQCSWDVLGQGTMSCDVYSIASAGNVHLTRDMKLVVGLGLKESLIC